MGSLGDFLLSIEPRDSLVGKFEFIKTVGSFQY
jgi:hypothetical protein